MVSICKKCNVSFCGCPKESQLIIHEPKPVRHISKTRSKEIQTLIDEITEGKITEEETRRLYEDIQIETRKELVLMRKMSPLVIGRQMKDKTFDDFPLKD
jgi:hypothetical protein